MKYLSRPLIDWAIHEIETKYPEDISILVGHKGWRIPEDGEEVAFNFFIPATDKGYSLAQTFIINEIGYDLFPMSWERVEGLAEVNESLTTCLADGIILYARNEKDKARFIQLQQILKDHLADQSFTFNKALEKINNAMELYKTMAFEESLCHVRKGAGFISQYLVEAIATSNGTYMKNGPQDIISTLKDFKQVPVHFIGLYEQLIKAEQVEVIKTLSYELIKMTRDFFSSKDTRVIKEEECEFQDLAAWYEEGRYTFRRIGYYCEQNDPFNSFSWGYHFQREFDCIQKDFGLKEMDLLGVFNPNDLSIFKERLDEIEAYIVSEIKAHGVKIRIYDTLEAFLNHMN